MFVNVNYTFSSCRTCEPEYFQIFKDMFLAIEMLESKEREKKGLHFEVFSKIFF